jgi:PleD family two-component response regulator
MFPSAPGAPDAFSTQAAGQWSFPCGKSRSPEAYKTEKVIFMLYENENKPPTMIERQRIMLVDNDHDMLSFLNLTLEQEGFDTIVVADVDSATDLLDNINPDLVILDTVSPEQDSLEILDRMRQHSKVPIIMLSTEYEAEKMREALSHGADDYIRLPFGIRPFIARIRAKLRRTHNVNTH